MLTGMIGNTTHATVTVHQENLTKGFTSQKSKTGKSLKDTEEQTTSTGSCTDDESREEGTYGGVSKCQQEHQSRHKQAGRQVQCLASHPKPWLGQELSACYSGFIIRSRDWSFPSMCQASAETALSLLSSFKAYPHVSNPFIKLSSNFPFCVCCFLWNLLLINHPSHKWKD